jgi:glucose uptake protein
MIKIYSLILILSWGSWVAMSQGIKYRNNHIRTLYIGLANLLFITAIHFITDQAITFGSHFWPCFFGGVLWSISGFFAFSASDKIGIAKAGGIWAPLNIFIGFLWGIFYFKELDSYTTTDWLFLAFYILLIITGIFLIIFSKGFNNKAANSRNQLIGVLSAFAAGILWGSYFIPIKITNVSMLEGSFPLAAGIVATPIVLILFKREIPIIDSKVNLIRTLLSGLLWGVGNYTMLLLVEKIGTGPGFTIGQLGVIVQALIGVFIFKDPSPRSKAAYITFIGIILATIGGISLTQ